MAPDLDFMTLMERAMQYTDQHSKGSVERGGVSIPVAVVRHQANGKDCLSVLAIFVDAVGFTWQAGERLGRPELKRLAEKFVNLTYKNAETNIDKLPGQGFPLLASERIGPVPAGDALAVRSDYSDAFTVLPAHSGFRVAARELHPNARDTWTWHRTDRPKPPQYSAHVVYGPAEAEEACERLRTLFLDLYKRRHPPEAPAPAGDEPG